MGECLIVRRGGESYELPVLDASCPKDVTVTAAPGASASFSVSITTPGRPAEYTYQWYKNGAAISGATGASLTLTGLTAAATYSVYCKVTNKAGSVASRAATLTVRSYLPAYTYTGSHQLINDGNFNWRLKLLTSGSLTFSHLGSGASAIDVFLVGGGGGGSDGMQTGGAGGYTKTVTEIVVNPNVAYPIIIGAGGSGTSNGNGVSGGESSAFGSRAAGGTGAKGTPEQNRGGSGGGGAHGSSTPGSGGSDGSNGAAAQLQGGYGQRSVAGPNGENGSTREFGAGDLYAGGGAGGSWYIGNENGLGGAGGGGNCAQPGTANTGGGGGSRYTNGTDHYPGGTGGSGIVIIRNTR